MIPPPQGKQKIVCIVGPTAVGKTALSIALAKAMSGEIISADSRQVYKGLDIGSGKVTLEEMEGVPHHLLDVADPKEVFSASNFVELGRKAIAQIAARGHVPIIAGGTGFYIDALVGKISPAGVPPNEALRAELEKLTLEELQKKLAALDPRRFETIEQKNPRRLVRAIEIATALGEVPQATTDLLYDVLWLGITIPLPNLIERIETRLLARLNEGMLAEAKHLHQEGLSYERMEELGLEYRYMARHLSGEISYEEMVEQLKGEIIKYAKRQMTWFKANKDIQWVAPTDINQVITLSKTFLAEQPIRHRTRKN